MVIGIWRLNLIFNAEPLFFILFIALVHAVLELIVGAVTLQNRKLPEVTLNFEK